MSAQRRSGLFDLLWDIRQSLRKRGISGTLRAVRRRLFPPRFTPNPFDLAHGTDTGGLIEIKGDHPSFAHARDYWGTPSSMLRGALARWADTLPATSCSVPDYTFIDFGCGKGRAVMIASELPFGASVGVELNPDLVAVAHANLALWARTPHPCRQIEVLHTDALAYPLPETPLLLYLFNPFDAHIIGLLAERIAAALPSRTHPIDIIYSRPEHIEPFESIPNIQILWKGEVPLTPEDTAADIFETTQQQCFLYRLTPHTCTS